MRAALGVFVVILLGCGHRDGNGAPSDGTTSGLDASDHGGGDDAANGGDDASNAGGADASNAGGDGAISTDASGAGTDAGSVSSTCAAPIAPSVTLSVSTGSYSGVVFRAGGQIYASALLDPAHQWLRWTGAAWNADPIPWPANLPSAQHPNYIGRVIPLPSGRALIVTDSYWLMTYDGVTMSPAIAPAPTPSQEMWGYAEDASGAYHVFWGNQEWISKPDGSWYPPGPIPMPGAELTQTNSYYGDGAAAVMADGRVVVLYVDKNYNAPARHGWITSHGPNETWSAPIDITPTWAVNAQDPQLYAPPGGGIVASLVGASTNYNVTAIWRSPDGKSFPSYDELGAAPPVITGECLDSLVASEYTVLYRSHAFGWDTLAGDAPASTTIYHSEVAALPDGKVFWVVGKSNGTDYLVTP